MSFTAIRQLGKKRETVLMLFSLSLKTYSTYGKKKATLLVTTKAITIPDYSESPNTNVE